MSVKNKAIDRNKHGKINRKYTGPHSTYFYQQTPSWWVKMTMTKPRRRLNKALCKLVLNGADPEGIVFPLGNAKPHDYFW